MIFLQNTTGYLFRIRHDGIRKDATEDETGKDYIS